LKEICFFDETLSSFILLNILSKVTTRAEGIPIGAFNLNIYSPIEEESKQLVDNITRLLTGITTHTFYHPVSIESL